MSQAREFVLVPTSLRMLTVYLLSLILANGYAQAFDREEGEVKRLSALVETSVTHHGPNCWNSALVASGALKHIRFTSPEEFLFFAESLVCQKISAEQRQAGDMQVYRRTLPGLTPVLREVHANIWLSSEVAFNKMTDFATAPYEITTNKKVNEIYGRTPEILRFYLEDSNKTVLQCVGDSCANSVEYRRCVDPEALKRMDPFFSLKIETLIDQLEVAIEQQVQRPNLASSDWKKAAEEALTALDRELQTTCSGRASFFCESSRLAEDSINQQLHRLQPSWLRGTF